MGLMLVFTFGTMFILTLAPTSAAVWAAQTVIDVSRIKPGEMQVFYDDSGVRWNPFFVVHRTAEQIAWLRAHPRKDEFFFDAHARKQQSGLDPVLRSLKDAYFVFEPDYWQRSRLQGCSVWQGIDGDWHTFFYSVWLDDVVRQVHPLWFGRDGRKAQGLQTVSGGIYFSYRDHAFEPDALYFIYDLAGRAVGYPYKRDREIRLLDTLGVPEHHYDAKGRLVVGPSDESSIAGQIRHFIWTRLI